MDWNWFFSALAQSVAAIIGLIGAFIFTKIVTEKNIYELNCTKINEIILKSNELTKQSDLINFEYYNEYFYKNMIHTIAFKVLQDFSSQKNINQCDDYYDEKSISKYDKKESIYNQIKELVKIFKDNPPQTDRDIRDYNIDINYRNEGKIICEDIEKQVKEYKFKIYNNIEYIKNFLNSILLKPKSFTFIKFIIWLLYSLFIFGVLVPMAMIPKSIEDNYLSIDLKTLFFFPYNEMQVFKVVILFLILIIFSILIIYFLHQINSIKYNEKDIETMNEYLRIETYSNYLKNEVENLNGK